MSAGAVHVIAGVIFVIVHVAVAGLGSTLPAASLARTRKVWSLRVSEAGAVRLSVPAKSKLADVVVVVEPSAGPAVMLVSGGVTSMIHVNEAGLGSVLWAASVAVTVKVCEPA